MNIELGALFSTPYNPEGRWQICGEPDKDGYATFRCMDDGAMRKWDIKQMCPLNRQAQEAIQKAFETGP